MVNMEWWNTMAAWLPELAERIPPALETVTRGRDDIVGVALFTDSDAGTLQPAALSAAHRDRLAVEFPRSATLYAWDPDEWDLLPARGERNILDPVMAKMRTLGAEVDESQWLSYTLHAFNWMVEGMRALSVDGFFDSAYPAANVSFWVTDTDLSPETYAEWVQCLNPAERCAPYVAYLREQRR